MSKVNFSEGRTIRPTRLHGGRGDGIVCDLARPQAELEVVARMMQEILQHEVWAVDGRICASDVHDMPWPVVERSLHRALSDARAECQKAMDALRSMEIAPPEHSPEVAEGYGYDCTGLQDGTYIRNPKGVYGTLVHLRPHADAEVVGVFTGRDSDHIDELAIAILRATFPEEGVAWCGSYDFNRPGDFVARGPASPTLAGRALACHKAAVGLVKGRAPAIRGGLQWGGGFSRWMDEDDDARDWLLEQLMAGERLHRAVDPEGRYGDSLLYRLDDDSPVPAYIAERLANSRIVAPEGGTFAYLDDEPGSPLRPLRAVDRIDVRRATPRKHAVRFQAFQEHCRHRRHWQERDCLHPDNRSYSDYCDSGNCPLVDQVYADERQPYGRDDDPAFDNERYEHNPLVRALHVNTERSLAWKAANGAAMSVLVNTVIHAEYNGAAYFAPMYHRELVEEAVGLGHLAYAEAPKPDGIGIMLKLGADLAGKVAEARAQAGLLS